MLAHLDLLESYDEVEVLDALEDPATFEPDRPAPPRGGRGGGAMKLVFLTLLLGLAPAARSQEPTPAPASEGARARFEAMSPERQEELRARLRRFQALTPASRPSCARGGSASRACPTPSARRSRPGGAPSLLSTGERRQILRDFDRLKTMAPERRAEIRTLFRRLVSLPASERARFLDNLRRFRQLTPDRRRDLLQRFGDQLRSRRERP
ncbi:MAG: DUF3106 domain-containing protein [bacterium]